MQNLSKEEIKKLPSDLRKAILGTVVIKALRDNGDELNLSVEEQLETIQMVTKSMDEVVEVLQKEKEKEIKMFFEKLKNDDEGEIEYEFTKH